jgi:hypothetical protein
MAGIINSLKASQSSLLRAKRFNLDAYGITLTLSLLQKGVYSQDLHTLPLTPRIHKRNITTYPPNSTSITVRERDSSSDAITFFETGDISIVKEIISPSTLLICNYSDHQPLKKRSALAINATSFYEIIPNQLIRTSNSCYQLDYNIPAYSLIAPQIKTSSPPLKIISLNRVYTLYRHKSGTLRYLLHVGDRVIENQPITHHSPILHLLPDGTNTNKPFALNISLELSNSKTINNLYIYSHVPKISLPNNAQNGF